MVRECVQPSWVRGRNSKTNFQTVLEGEDEGGKGAGKELVCVEKGTKTAEDCYT